MTDMPDFVRVSEPNTAAAEAAWSRWATPCIHHVYVNRSGVYQKFFTLNDPYSEEAEYICQFLNQGYIKYIDDVLDNGIMEDFDADA